MSPVAVGREAGAVAEANAASTMEKAVPRPKIKNARPNTRREAARASKTVITAILPPLAFKVLNLKNSPMPNAINASAISDKKPIPPTTERGIRSRQNGPSATPVKMYAVTFGNFTSFVSRVARKPKISINATEIIITETLSAPPSLS